MSQPQIKAKVHNPIVREKVNAGIRKWWADGSPRAEIARERIRALNPMKNASTRLKVSAVLKAMHHKPIIQGGNGRGMTAPQKILMVALGPGWEPEFAVSLGKRTPGYPTHYKIDLAHPLKMIAIQVDGFSHHSRKAQDEKKTERLSSLGWKVLRLWNRDILNWNNSGRPMETSISMTLRLHGIHLSR